MTGFRCVCAAAGLFILICLAALTGCSPEAETGSGEGSREIIVAAASNLSGVFEPVASQFTQRTNIRLVYSFGSTAGLAAQIENGAPFDVFAAADLAHVDDLIAKGLVEGESRAVYARGRLALWTASHSRRLARLEDISDPEVRVVAIAKPDVAPYGRAAVETLQALNLWRAIEGKAVYGMNVGQVKQYAASGNADVAFIPRSLIRPGEGQHLEVDEWLHRPIQQAIGVVSASSKRESAWRFVEFLMGAESQALLQEYGYGRGDID